MLAAVVTRDRLDLLRRIGPQSALCAAFRREDPQGLHQGLHGEDHDPFALAFFGVTIAANLALAVFAVTGWTGLLAKNGHVASIDYAATSASPPTMHARTALTAAAIRDDEVRAVTTGGEAVRVRKGMEIAIAEAERR